MYVDALSSKNPLPHILLQPVQEKVALECDRFLGAAQGLLTKQVHCQHPKADTLPRSSMQILSTVIVDQSMLWPRQMNKHAMEAYC